MWKALQHPNVLPLIGAMMQMSEGHFAMISEWMVNGNIGDFVKAHPDVNRITLVSLRFESPYFRSVYSSKNSQLEGVAKGLIHIHDQGMVHGDLKGVRARLLALCFRLIHLNFYHEGEHTDRSDWQSPPLRLWASDDQLGPRESQGFKFGPTKWYNEVDEPGAFRSGTVWARGFSSNQVLRLLCTWDGDI